MAVMDASFPTLSVASPACVDAVLVDDHPVFAEALASVMANHPEFGVVSTAPDVAEGARLLGALRPGLAVIDVRIGADDGLDLLADLRRLSPATRAVVLTGHLQPGVLDRAQELGAHAVLPKGMGLRDLLGELVRVAVGAPYATTAPAADLLSAREVEVLQLLADGHDPRQIARHLELSPHTVRDHIKGARTKLDVQSQLAAVVAAVRLGVVTVRR